MSDELSNATRIAALEEQVRQLTADAAAFNSILKRGQEWMNSAHDSWQRMCNQREEAREALTKALADNATLNTAKDRLIDERNACLRELDAARQELSDRNAYAERLMAENVRLSNEAAEARADLVREQRPWTVRLSIATVDGYEVCDCTVADIGHAERILLVTCDDVTDMRVDIATERERCGVMEAEVKAWHAAEHLRKDEPHNEFMRLAEARARTRETHALDAAKFVGGGQ